MATAAPTLPSLNWNERFNDEAAAWDKNPIVHLASKQASEALLARFPSLFPQYPSSQAIKENVDVLEIGCGTGLLSLLIAPHVRRVVAIDAATGMIDVLHSKLNKQDVPGNIIPVAVLLEDPEDPALPPATEGSGSQRMKFDLITSHLVLHHIFELQKVLTTMFDCLKPGGKIALTDYEDFGPEAKKFHPAKKMFGVARHGLAVREMEKLLKEVGFEDVKVERAWSLTKHVERFEGEFGDRGYAENGQGETMEFPFVVCLGRKP